MDYEKKYKEMKARVLEIGRGYVQGVDFSKPRQIAEYIDPELKESEDERIMKDIIAAVETYGDFTQDRKEEIYAWLEKRDEQKSAENSCKKSDDITTGEKDMTEYKKGFECGKQQVLKYPEDFGLCWLEKQGGQDNNRDVDILQRFSFYSYKDEPNILYLSELYVNEEYRNKGIGTKILKIADKVSTSMGCNYIRLKTESCSDAERLYKENGYNTLKKEGNQVWLEKQGEQKPVEWSYPYGENETVDKLIAIAECLEMDGDCLFNRYTGTECGKFLRDLARKQVECKPVEWSEEDEKMFDKLYEIFYRYGYSSHPEIDLSSNEAINLIHWLKSLKDRVRPQQEWSKEDEKMVDGIIKAIDTHYAVSDYNEMVSWLKSRCPRHITYELDAPLDYDKDMNLIYPTINHWKPSEQNIKDLEWCADLVKDKMGAGFHRLQVFIDELKSL